MCLDVADGCRINPGDAVGFIDHLHLARDAGCGEPHLARAIVVDRRSADQGQDAVAVRDGLVEALEHDDARAAAEHRAPRFGIERAAVSVRGKDAALVEGIAGPRELDLHTAGQRHVAFTLAKALAGEVDGHQ